MDTPPSTASSKREHTFTNGHGPAPLCAPSRASFFTGYSRPPQVSTGTETPGRQSSVEKLSVGYTVNVGIAHTSAYKTPMGFDERCVVENKDRYLADGPNDTPLPSEQYYPGECAKAPCAREVL